MNEFSYVDAADLAAQIRNKTLSPVELMDVTISRIESRNPSLNALVFVDFEHARAQARAAERAVMAGDPLGCLHGVPTVIKDLFDSKAGWPTTFGGIRALDGFIADQSGIFAERIPTRGGAILLGKTNSPVFGFRGTTDNFLFGPTCNPFDNTRNSGGSSGGSAAAVADGLFALAEGTDGGGSIRIPSSWCGVFGFKPSFGRVPALSSPNAFGAISPFLFDGPITRSVGDAALAMTALAGYDPRDPFALDESVDYVAATQRSIRGMRIAFSPDLDVFPVESEVAEVVARAARAFELAGAHVEQVRVGIRRPQRELSDLWCRMVTVNAISGLDRFRAAGYDLLGARKDDLPLEYRHWVETCRGMTAQDALADQAARSEVYHALQGVLNHYDLLVTPTLTCLPVPNATDGNTKGPTLVAGEDVDPLIGWCMTYPVNFTGHPAASVPAGLSKDKLPIGMQIIGRRYGDCDVLAASAAFERLQPWKSSYTLCRERSLAIPDVAP